MEGSRDFGLVFSDEEVSSWDHQAEQPRVRRAAEVVHHGGKKLLAGGAAEPPLEALLDGRDAANLDRLLGFSVEPTIEPGALYAIAAVLKPADVHLAVHMLAAVSVWYVAALLEERRTRTCWRSAVPWRAFWRRTT